MKKARDNQPDRADATAAPTDESERMELVRLRGEVKAKDAELAELRMQVEFAKKVASWFASGKQ